jgi:hypothetical protein
MDWLKVSSTKLKEGAPLSKVALGRLLHGFTEDRANRGSK